MNPLLYIAKGELFYKQENSSQAICCNAIENYKKNLQEINQRKEWKTKGTGAAFMGVINYDDHAAYEKERIFPSDAIICETNTIIYSALLHNGTAIYSKTLTNTEEQEGLILRKNDFKVYEMDFDAINQRLALSVSALGYERHLAILELESADIHYVTEGDCHDCNPSFDPHNPDILYYDSCGLAYDRDGNLCGLGPKGIFRLNLKTGSLDEILCDPKYDFSKPKMDTAGNLYFIKKPYQSKNESTFSIKDIIFAPVKITKAILGWLDFFTQRYAGESLKTTTGSHPAKMKQRSEEELFIEGNLINVKKSLEENQKSGEKYPGIAPKSWELIKMPPNQNLVTLKKGVLSYQLKKDGSIFYSNGKHLIEIESASIEKLLFEQELITKIICS
ncbi:hypothetical protein [Neisseria sp. Ec49-e6-T10]|uniref:hypothetical protein n=1 Tax=Neisseria sp. Ec49-e6-T10 TaxID=3140744 RepID=UPI003EC0E870